MDDLKLRPIVAGPACQTHRISNLYDTLLKPLIKHVPSFLRDTTDFLNSLPNRIPKETLFATFDVESLYSWLRFIDDIDMKWTHGKTTLEAFLKTSNSFNPTIRFTAEVSDDEHVFLDTMSHLADNKVAVDLYTKPTDSHQYLPTSCHPPHCSKNIPYSLAPRIRRICSDDETFEKRSKDLSEQLKQRGYQKQVIDQAIKKVRHM